MIRRFHLPALILCVAAVLATLACKPQHLGESRYSTEAMATAAAERYAANVAPLIDPAKLATLGARGANPRLQKSVYWLSVADAKGVKPKEVVEATLRRLDIGGEAASLTGDSLLRNLEIARRLGCLDRAGLKEMRRGRAPTVRLGPQVGQELSVDHVIPRAVCPELDNVIANLEFLPERLNQSKGDTVGERQLALAEKVHRAGLLSGAGLEQVRAAAKR